MIRLHTHTVTHTHTHLSDQSLTCTQRDSHSLPRRNSLSTSIAVSAKYCKPNVPDRIEPSSQRLHPRAWSMEPTLTLHDTDAHPDVQYESTGRGITMITELRCSLWAKAPGLLHARVPVAQRPPSLRQVVSTIGNLSTQVHEITDTHAFHIIPV
jgi:hypothetical protein